MKKLLLLFFANPFKTELNVLFKSLETVKKLQIIDLLQPKFLIETKMRRDIKYKIINIKY